MTHHVPPNRATKRQPAHPNESLRSKVQLWTRTVARYYFSGNQGVEGVDGDDVASRSTELLDQYIAAARAAAANKDRGNDKARRVIVDSWTYQLAAAASLSIVAVRESTTCGSGNASDNANDSYRNEDNDHRRCHHEEQQQQQQERHAARAGERGGFFDQHHPPSLAYTWRRRFGGQFEQQPGAGAAQRRAFPAVITPSSSYEDLAGLASSSASPSSSSSSTTTATKPNVDWSSSSFSSLGTTSELNLFRLSRYHLAQMSRGRFTVQDVMEMERRIISTMLLDSIPPPAADATTFARGKGDDRRQEVQPPLVVHGKESFNQRFGLVSSADACHQRPNKRTRGLQQEG